MSRYNAIWTPYTDLKKFDVYVNGALVPKDDVLNFQFKYRLRLQTSAMLLIRDTYDANFSKKFNLQPINGIVVHMIDHFGTVFKETFISDSNKNVADGTTKYILFTMQHYSSWWLEHTYPRDALSLIKQLNQNQSFMRCGTLSYLYALALREGASGSYVSNLAKYGNMDLGNLAYTLDSKVVKSLRQARAEQKAITYFYSDMTRIQDKPLNIPAHMNLMEFFESQVDFNRLCNVHYWYALGRPYTGDVFVALNKKPFLVNTSGKQIVFTNSTMSDHPFYIYSPSVVLNDQPQKPLREIIRYTNRRNETINLGFNDAMSLLLLNGNTQASSNQSPGTKVSNDQNTTPYAQMYDFFENYIRTNRMLFYTAGNLLICPGFRTQVKMRSNSQFANQIMAGSEASGIWLTLEVVIYVKVSRFIQRVTLGRVDNPKSKHV